MFGYATACLHWALVIVLVVAALAKTVDRTAPADLAALLRQGLRLPGAMLLARVLPVLEMAVALLLAIGPTRLLGLALAAVLFGCLSLGAAVLSAQPASYRCNCFGRSTRVIGWRTAARNLLLAGTAIILLSLPGGRTDPAVSLAALLTACLLAALTWSAASIAAVAGPRPAGSGARRSRSPIAPGASR